LSHNHKIPKSNPPTVLNRLVERRRCQPKGFDCSWTYYDDDQLCNGNDDRIAVLGRPEELSILSGIEAIEVPCPLWSILAGRLLHVLTTALGTLFQFAALSRLSVTGTVAARHVTHFCRRCVTCIEMQHLNGRPLG